VTCGLFSLLCFKLLYMALVLVLRGCLVSTPLDCVVFGGRLLCCPAGYVYVCRACMCRTCYVGRYVMSPPTWEDTSLDAGLLGVTSNAA
jgi:hypothetical protein